VFWSNATPTSDIGDHFIPALATELHILHLTFGTGEAERLVLVPKLSLGEDLGSDKGSVMVQALSTPNKRNELDTKCVNSHLA